MFTAYRGYSIQLEYAIDPLASMVARQTVPLGGPPNDQYYQDDLFETFRARILRLLPS